MYGANGMDPKAQKRFDNDRTKAAQSALMGQAAKQAIPNPSARPRVNSSAVSLQQNSVSSTPGGFSPSATQAAPVSGPQQQSPVMQPQFTVQETIQNDMDLESFLSSPTVQQALSRSRLRKYFKRNNPSGVVNDLAADALSNLLHNT